MITDTCCLQVILSSFSPPSEEVKSAASYALGSIAVGNLQQYLPFVLQEIETQPKRQYLLLHSLKEVHHLVFFSYLNSIKTPLFWVFCYETPMFYNSIVV